ncbi:MAG: PPC domain-containing protein, partial [Leptolyngbyaceae bacterium]|nr:PPC domain-containing protein [Leptolyngbyaceae bacterium]
MIFRHIHNRILLPVIIGGVTAILAAGNVSAQILDEGGFLDLEETVQHTFRGSAGQELFISAESVDFDTYLTLYGPGGRYVGENDDYGGTNSGLAVTLPWSGVYTITVGGYDQWADRGRYFVTVNESTPSYLLYEENSLSPGRYAEYSLQG